MATREKERKAPAMRVTWWRGAQDTGSFSYSWCFRSAWNDALVRKALWEDKRPYVLSFTLSVNAVLILLAALTSLTEFNNVQVTLTCLRHSTLAMLYAAAFSCATRFLSLSAVKASVVKKFEVRFLVDDLLGFKVLSLLIAFFACLYHVGAGIALAADVARVQATAGAMVLTASLIFLMGTDIRATFRAWQALCRDTGEAWRQHLIRKLQRGIWKAFCEELAAVPRILLGIIIATFCALVLGLIFFTLSPDGALSFHVAQAAGGGI
ncbi:hypothetical protein MTO96_017004 [Rhipicephalus appendiculatus]